MLKRHSTAILAATAFILCTLGGVFLAHAQTQPREWVAAPQPGHPFEVTGPVTPLSDNPRSGVTPKDMSKASLLIPSLGIYAPVEQVGTNAGELTLPAPDVTRVGQLHDTFLVAGHVSYNGARGALYRLHSIRPGAHIYMRDASGHRYTWLTVSLASIHKAPLDYTTYAKTPRDLVLVTCGGTVRLLTLPSGRRVHTYSDNVVVVATPVGGRSVMESTSHALDGGTHQ